MIDWNRTIFLHTGWTRDYSGSEAPVGAHKYLQTKVGVEASNFVNANGWCFGYAPVTKSRKRQGSEIPIGDRSINITKLGAARGDSSIDRILVVWTATNPDRGPVVVGAYLNATVYRKMQITPDGRHYIAKANAGTCHLVPFDERIMDVPQKRKGFPGQAAAWFPGQHQDGPAKEFLVELEPYLANLPN